MHRRRPSMGRRAVRTMSEQDAFTAWRFVLCYIGRPGVRRSIKQDSNRRERRNMRRSLRHYQKEDV